MTKSEEFFNEAKKYIPGGVNSPVRAFRSVDGKPLSIKSGKGSKITDVDGNEYIDCVMSWGPLLLGHAHEEVLDAIKKTIDFGTSFGAPTEAETTLAQLITELVPGIEKVRLVNSGTEATMSAARLARGYTKKDKIIKFEGCYHGHADSFLIKGGSGALTFGQPSSPGVTKSTSQDTLCAGYNNIDSVKSLYEKYPNEIACVIVEPVAGNMGVVLPEKKFLQELRNLTLEYKSLLIFDEVITGFRLAPGGAQQYFNVLPDLTTLGKIIGGGLPVGAFGGKSEIMDQMAPDGPVYQAGTLSGNPLAVSAGIATLKIIQRDLPYNNLEKMGNKLFDGLKNNANNSSIPISFNNIGSMGCGFFTANNVNTFDDAMTSNTEQFAKFHKNMLKRGIYCAPSQFEAMFISTAHSEEDIEQIIVAAKKSLEEI